MDDQLTTAALAAELEALRGRLAVLETRPRLARMLHRGRGRALIAIVAVALTYAVVGGVQLAGATNQAAASVYTPVEPVSLLTKTYAASGSGDVAVAGTTAVP
jgi:hypothetical protein